MCVIKPYDWIIDLGREGGENGVEIMQASVASDLIQSRLLKGIVEFDCSIANE